MFMAAVLLVCDRDSEEIFYKERDVEMGGGQRDEEEDEEEEEEEDDESTSTNWDITLSCLLTICNKTYATKNERHLFHSYFFSCNLKRLFSTS